MYGASVSAAPNVSEAYVENVTRTLNKSPSFVVAHEPPESPPDTHVFVEITKAPEGSGEDPSIDLRSRSEAALREASLVLAQLPKGGQDGGNTSENATSGEEDATAGFGSQNLEMHLESGPTPGSVIFPAVLVFGLVWNTIPTAATHSREDELSGFRWRSWFGGASSADLIVTDLLLFTVTTAIQLGFLLGIGILYFGVEISGSLALLALVVFTATMGFVGIGSFIGSFTSDLGLAGGLGTVVAFTMMILTGSARTLGLEAGGGGSTFFAFDDIVPMLSAIVQDGAGYGAIETELLALMLNAALILAVAVKLETIRTPG